mgnify:CR=1 FL=1
MRQIESGQQGLDAVLRLPALEGEIGLLHAAIVAEKVRNKKKFDEETNCMAKIIIIMIAYADDDDDDESSAQICIINKQMENR